MSEETIELEKLNAVIVPLRAFNENFQRLGFGGGFYDKTFPESPNQNLLAWLMSFNS